MSVGHVEALMFGLIDFFPGDDEEDFILRGEEVFTILKMGTQTYCG